jgi:hypothetical protein
MYEIVARKSSCYFEDVLKKSIFYFNGALTYRNIKTAPSIFLLDVSGIFCPSACIDIAASGVGLQAFSAHHLVILLIVEYFIVVLIPVILFFSNVLITFVICYIVNKLINLRVPYKVNNFLTR